MLAIHLSTSTLEFLGAIVLTTLLAVITFELWLVRTSLIIIAQVPCLKYILPSEVRIKAERQKIGPHL